jgi:hypothetical protein
MNRQLFISCLACIFIHQQAATAQACRDVTPAEQQLYQKLTTAWDKAVLPAARRDGWDGKIHDDHVTPTVARGKPMPERPMMLCDEDRFSVDRELSDGSERKKMIFDSMHIYMDQLGQSPSKEKMESTRIHISRLGGQVSMQVSAGINIPLFILSSPNEGPTPSACHRISLPGAPIAYELTWHSGDEADRFKIMIGLGKWKDDVKQYEPGSELIVHYHFNHPFPTAVIENMIITISAGSLQEARRLVANIDWATLNAILE